MNNYHEWDWDNLKFIVQESFILCIAVFLKYERYEIVEHLLKQRYYLEKDQNYGQSKMHSFGVFRNYLESLNQRNKRLGLRRLSVHADIMKERCTNSGISFNQIMQADFLLYLSDAIQGLKEEQGQKWWPETLIFKSFHGGIFEIFLRAESTEYFNRLAPALDVKSKTDFKPFFDGIKKEAVYIPKWNYHGINPSELMNFEKLCSRA